MNNKHPKHRKIGRRPIAGKPPLSPRQAALLEQAAKAHAAGDRAFAERGYRVLVDEKVRVPHPYCNLAQLYDQSERYREARRLWKTALTLAPDFLEPRLGLARHYELTGASKKAIKVYRSILARHPDHVPARYLLANQCKARGEFEQAKALYREVMRRQPEYTQAHFALSRIHSYHRTDDPHLETMRRLLQQADLTTDQRVQLTFALSKAFEDLQDYEQAFRHLELGNRLRRETFHYQIESDAELIDNIIQTFNAKDLARLHVEGQASRRPIFIVGMVRSGTSLVEKILSSHPDVHGAGELQTVFLLASQLFLKDALHSQFASLDAYPARAFDQFGRAYLDRLAVLNNRAPRVTDKMPFNMLMIGLIRVALPNATIIHCRRDARDTCLSIFRQNFTTGNYRFGYDLKSVAQYHNHYRKLMRHWHRVFPGAIHDVQYEALVGNPEQEIRRLLETCDLEWQGSCLEFNQSPGAVNTASAFQVRQPIYLTSVNLWQKYEQHLRPMLDALEEV